MIALQLQPVPIPDNIVCLIDDCLPTEVLAAELDADTAVREVLRCRPLASDEDRQDREVYLARLARANKALAKFDPRLIVRGAA